MILPRRVECRLPLKYICIWCRTRVEFELVNLSTVRADWIEVRFSDAATDAARRQIGGAESEGSELRPDDVYTLQWQILHRPVLKLVHTCGSLAPTQHGRLTVDCRGKLGCTSAVVVVSYGSADSTMMREVKCEIAISVYRPMEIVGFDIRPVDARRCLLVFKIWNRASSRQAFEVGLESKQCK